MAFSKYDFKDGRATITMDRGDKRNAVNNEMTSEVFAP